MTPRPRPHASGARGTTACSFGSRIAAALMTTCVFVAAGVPVVADGQRPLHAIHLGTLGSGISRATGVNDHGQVVGWSRSAEGVTHAFIWTAAAGMRDLGTLGGDFSSAVAINNSGLTIGDSRTADGLSHAVAWTAAAGAIDLVPQSACSTAVALNDTGMVVGWFNTSDAFCNTRSSHAFVWTAASGAIDIGTLGGAASYATAVNGQGMVVGGSTIPGDAATHAFAWSPARSMTDLGTIGGNFAEALAVNDAGMVTGAATIAGDTARHPFVWTDADGMIDLGRSGFPRGINNRGVVVGAFATVDGGACLFDFLSCDPHAFSWTAAGGLIDLGTLGGNYSMAVRINEDNIAVGESRSASGAVHAAMWSADGRIVDLDPGPGAVGSAVAVNGNGVIVGFTSPIALVGDATLWAPATAFVTPTVTWPTPADIVYGTPLGASQLNATTDLPGSFAYSPPEGTILHAGAAQTLSVTFTPDDLQTYTRTTATASINVAAATPVITWPRPAPIAYGTALGAAQLNATADVAGTFLYSPPAGTILAIGAARPLAVRFVPDDSANYNLAAASVTIDVTSSGPPAQPPFQLLHSFSFADGATPYGALTKGNGDVFYGTTYQGGLGYGTVYKTNPAGAVTTIHAFTYSDGANPFAPVLLGADGFLYGTTVFGGSFGFGTVFRMDAAGTITTLHHFTASDGAYPYAGLLEANGLFYGTTAQGGPAGAGTVYRVDAHGAFTTLHAFNFADGATPYARLTQGRDGSFYGTAITSGPFGGGTIFRIDADGNLTTLHAFSFGDGAYSYSGVIQGGDGAFYGTTYFGGAFGQGTVFRLDGSGALTTLHAFANGDGANPYATPVQASDGFFYGSTSSGGASFAGTIYRMDAAGGFTTIHTFIRNDGATPYGALVQSSDGYLYGTTQSGGPLGAGAIFRIAVQPPRPLIAGSQLVVSPATVPFGTSATLAATLTSVGVPLTGRTVTFTLGGQPVGTAIADTNGFAVLFAVPLAGFNAGTYAGAVTASFAGDASYLASSGIADLIVLKRTPSVSWGFPSPIVHGAALDDTQLNATADVPGTFQYRPPAGTILPVGPHQVLALQFTPLDTTNIASYSDHRTIDVLPRAPTQATLTPIHEFAGGDGATPYASLVRASDGYFYGTTAYGGAFGYGTVYRVDGAGSTTTLHAFTAADGAYPYAALIEGADGVLYGTTAFGGPDDAGTVFRISKAGDLSVLHAFNVADGAYPYAALFPLRGGTLYGTTSEGGFTGFGTVFRLDPDGTLTTLHTFANNDGAYPYAGLLGARDGWFYGTTLQGGEHGYGTVYRIDARGTLTTVQAFAWLDGAYPYASLVEGSDRALYGTTTYGGASFGASGTGTIFRIADGVMTWVHSLTSPEGAFPYAPLMQRSDGFFYGTTSSGGAGGRGTIYRVDAAGNVTVEHAFGWRDGATPYAGLVEARDGSLYGTTQEGGAHGVGTVFVLAERVATQLVVPTATGVYGGTVTVSATLTAAAAPVAGATIDFSVNGASVGAATTDASGTATRDGVSLAGLDPATYPGAITASFAGDAGYAPSVASADLIVDRLTPLVTWPSPSAIVYGTALDATQLNATANVAGEFFYSPPAGVVLPVGAGQLLAVQFVPADSRLYKPAIAYTHIDVSRAAGPSEASFDALHVFNGADGASPYGGLVLGRDGFFYGTTLFGGPFGWGTVYRMDASGSVVTLHAFGFSDGAYPYAGLTQAADGSFYGTTYYGGIGYGTVYRIDPSGAFTTLHTFTYSDGAYPFARVLQAADGLLYGTTYSGGFAYGTIYRLDPVGGELTTLHRFDGTNGVYSYGALMQARDGSFYGTTNSGGPSGYGTVYRLDRDAAITVVHAFGYSDGANPFVAPLFQASDGSLYGTTPGGGTGGAGTVYRIDGFGGFTTLHNFSFADGATPYSPLIEGADGYFYATTGGGGVNGWGTVYRLDAGGALTTLRHFAYGDGASPIAGLVETPEHAFYGTTGSGGIGYGTAFWFRLRRIETHLSTARVTADYGSAIAVTATLTAGASPLRGVEVSFTLNGEPVGSATTDVNGIATVAGVSLAGIAPGTYANAVEASYAGDGSYSPASASADLVITKLTPIVSWPTPAAIVYGTLLDDAQLNATANISGAFIYSPPAGTILPVGAGQVLTVEFVAADSTIYARVIAHVSIDVALATAPTEASFAVLHIFTGHDGNYPGANLTQANDGSIYGTTMHGGTGYGNVYRIDADGTVTTVHDFASNDGAFPTTALTQAIDGFFYGTTAAGGSGDFGTVYRMDSTGAIVTLHEFESSDGAYPYGTLIQATDGFLYGTTYSGGANGLGTAFRVDPATGETTTLHAFNGSDGAFPLAGLIQARDGFFYGTTNSSGPNGFGTVYRIDTAGAVTVLHAFSIGDGANPNIGRLLEASDGLLYGTTGNGGVFGSGVVYRIDAAGQFFVLHAFNGSDGASPFGSLIQAADGLLYGMTFYGGTGGGTAFRLDAAGGLTTLHTFNGADGANPITGLLQTRDGALVGTATGGGVGLGTAFRIALVPARPTTQLSALATVSYGGAATVTATLTAAGVPVPGRQVFFILDAVASVSAITDANGVATVSDVRVGPYSPGTYSGRLQARFVGDAAYAESFALGDLVVTRATPIVTWTPPAPIVVGTPLSDVQLNAVANVFGSFIYDPPFGTVLPAGAGQRLSVTFVPFDDTNYAAVTLSVAIDVTGSPAVDFGTFSIGTVEIPLFAADGAATAVWSVVDGIVPPGMKLRTDGPAWFPPTAAAGLIGVATTPGSYEFTLRVTADGQSSDVRCRMKITALVVGDPFELPGAFVGSFYTYTLSAAGAAGPLTWTLDVVPSGLTFDAGGTLSGTPSGPGFYTIGLSVSDGIDTVYRSVSLDVSAIAITTPAVLPQATEFQPYTVVLSAAGGSPPYTFFANSLPPGLTLDPSGTISGTVGWPGKWGFRVAVIDANAAVYGKNMSIEVVGATPVLASVTPYGQRFDDCTIGVPCTLGVGVSNGGAAPFTWSAAHLPPGMWMRFGDGAVQSYVGAGDAQIVGTPTATGTYAIEVTATDANGVAATDVIPLHVSTLVESDFPFSGIVNVPYVTTARVLGGSASYTVAAIDGDLPAGLVLDPSTMRVEGTPVETGTFRFAWQFTDTNGETLLATRYYTIISGRTTIVVNDQRDLGSATIGFPYSRTLSACCAPSFTWSVVDGTLPDGLELSSDGTLRGTPTAAGVSTFLVRATDATNTAKYGQRQFTLNTTPLLPTTSYLLPDGFVNSPYSIVLAAGGAVGPLTWTLARSNHLPPGLTLEADGTLHGTPTAGGRFVFGVTAVDTAENLLVAGFEASIYPEGATPPVRHLEGNGFTSGIGYVDIPLRASGGNGAYTWDVVDGTLPPGLSIRTDMPDWFPQDASAAIAGVATVPGTYTFTLRATSGLQSTNQRTTISINGIVVTDLYQLPDAFTGMPYSYTLSAVNDGVAVHWAANGALPPGMTVSDDGVLSGTPTAAGFWNINLRLTDGQDVAYTGISLNISDIAITTPSILPNATQNEPYSALMTANGGSGPYSFSADFVPYGLALDPSGTISGGAQAPPGKYVFTVTATDTGGRSYSKRMAIDVISVPAAPPALFGTLDDCTFGVRCERQIAVVAGGSAPFTWTANGLPPGMAIRSGDSMSPWVNAGDGEVVGSPTAFGTYAVTITATDALGVTATATIPLRVSPLFVTRYAPNASVGDSYSFRLRVVGGPSQRSGRDEAGLYDVSLVDGSLPEGLTLDSSDLRLAGTVEQGGFFAPRLRFVDGGGTSVEITNYLFIAAPEGAGGR